MSRSGLILSFSSALQVLSVSSHRRLVCHSIHSTGTASSLTQLSSSYVHSATTANTALIPPVTRVRLIGPQSRCSGVTETGHGWRSIQRCRIYLLLLASAASIAVMSSSARSHFRNLRWRKFALAISICHSLHTAAQVAQPGCLYSTTSPRIWSRSSPGRECQGRSESAGSKLMVLRV